MLHDTQAVRCSADYTSSEVVHYMQKLTSHVTNKYTKQFFPEKRFCEFVCCFPAANDYYKLTY